MSNLRFSSKIFIDGGVPEETAQAKKLLGFLDGQTTNPTLIAKNLKTAAEKKGQPLHLTQDLALNEYKRIVQEMNKIIPEGSISIQVFANADTKAQDLLIQGRLRYDWIPNHSIKFPCTTEGLKAVNVACQETPVNITLVFSQSQAAAVYEATRGAKYPVFISPFVGRLDDLGQNGMQVVGNIKRMYEGGDGHVEVLTASIRSLDHLMYALQLKSDIVTIPFKVFDLWSQGGFLQPDANFEYDKPELKDIPYREDVVLGHDFTSYDLFHELTAKGVQTFWNDWTELFN